MDPCSGYYILTGMGVPIHTTQTGISRSGALPSQPVPLFPRRGSFNPPLAAALLLD
jgi:hypothetical protein